MTGIGSHPIDLVEEYLSRITDQVTVELGVYRYAPQTVRDPRKVHQVALDGLREEYESLRSKLRAREEIAFQSRVRLNRRGVVAHLPMIDFTGSPPSSTFQDTAAVLRDFSSEGAYLYDSGRSFHMYGLALITRDKWLELMGRLLLLNLPGKEPVVDARWVGHRLIGGYGALRWSSRSRLYQGEPRLVTVY